MTPFTDFFSIILPTVKLKLGEENEDASEASIQIPQYFAKFRQIWMVLHVAAFKGILRHFAAFCGILRYFKAF